MAQVVEWLKYGRRAFHAEQGKGNLVPNCIAHIITHLYIFPYRAAACVSTMLEWQSYGNMLAVVGPHLRGYIRPVLMNEELNDKKKRYTA